MYFYKNAKETIRRERIKNAISSYGSLAAKIEFLKGYRLSEDSYFKQLREWTSDNESPALENFQNLYKDLNRILGWESVKNISKISDELKTIKKQLDFEKFIQSSLLPRNLDNPNAFWVIMPIVKDNKIQTFRVLIINFEDVVNVDLSKNEITFTVKNNENLDLKAGTYVVNNQQAYEKTDYQNNDTYFVDYQKHKIKNRLFGQLGGQTAASDLDGYCQYYISFVKGAFDLGAKLFLNCLDAELRRQVQLHSLTIAKAVTCSNDKCKDGTIYDLDLDGNTIESGQCPTCHGTGETAPSLRLGDKIVYGQDIIGTGVDREKAKTEGVKDFIQFIEPPLETFREQMNIIKDLELRLEKALSQVTSKTFAQSADAQNAQWQGNKHLADTIGLCLWKNIEMILQGMQDLLLLDSPEIIIEYPDSFVDENIEDLRAKLNDPNVTNPFELRVLQSRLYEKEFANNPAQLNAMKFIISYDPLSTMKDVTNMTIAMPDKVRYSTTLPTILQRLILENPERGDGNERTGFGTWSMEKIKKESDKIYNSEFAKSDVNDFSDGSEFNDTEENDTES